MFSDYYIYLPQPRTPADADEHPQRRLRAAGQRHGKGTTGDFCTPSKSPTGAPGTAAPGENGCISNCGTDVVTSEPATYKIFRDAVATKANRKKLADSVIKFISDYGLDGAETTGFFLLLADLELRLPAGKTHSVTAPASYWYLKQFPIQAISLASDYIVYMTYDLHGQWDYGNKYGSPGLGICLRSHVNLTKTINWLSMITNAGVPSNMIAVGVSTYGRSFQMAAPGCWTEQ
ncbi:Killer toxin subunits alpha/beta 5 [Colletotrichum plurivorum]|uniref:Killer toxin subunits alpha/beta 5 n=1 Tax=Colletotrichum plurivorum TaxID=2175906 RepID=A0A8H6J9B8_9PEZI|nr:Killer toxin subunits alpha/beta 5 [Colletotrichum plurivorum]